MPGLMSRGVVLTASRVSNFAILMLSPLLLVRILDVEAYGRYQEFMVYATLLVTICGFGIDASLTYFLPRYPDRETEFVSQTSALVLTSSSIVLGALLLNRQAFSAISTYDFTIPLAAYVFCFVNLNWLEYFWIAKGRTDLVLYYSAGRLGFRVSVLLLAAYWTRDVDAIIWSVVAAEAIRLIIVGVYLVRARLLAAFPSSSRVLEQLRFIGPIGLASLMQQASRNIGKLFVSSVIGPAALAYYAVASYLLPMVMVIRGSIADVVFPELVRIKGDLEGALRLWQRSNIVFCALLFPPFVALTFYAELFVTTLFTEQYLSAIPVFHIYLIWLLRRCFNMDVLLRTRGKTGFMLTGTSISTVVNLVLMILLYRWLGLIGPAVAFISAEILLEVYNAILVKREFRLTTSQLVDWRGILRIAAGCLAGVPMLLLVEQLPAPDLLRASVGSILFFVTTWAVAFRLGVTDIGRMAGFGASFLLRRPFS